MVAVRVSTLFLALLLAVAVSALPVENQESRIVGGSVTTINQYPFAAVVLFSSGSYFTQSCGGSIINQRFILSAASCFPLPLVSFYRIRLGSSFANSGGVVYEIDRITNHASFNTPSFLNNDISIVRTTSEIAYSMTVLPANLPAATYTFADNQPIIALGWGMTSGDALSTPSEQLRQVEMRAINQTTCTSRYSFPVITANHLCTGWLDVGGRDTCYQDNGSPQLHNNFVVGITSASTRQCGDSYLPSITTRVTRYIDWIRNNST